ncbi:MAG: glycosyltransferase [Leptospirillia bacterium]
MISVLVASRNRPEQIVRCLRVIGEGAKAAVGEVIVVDQSDPPYEGLAGALGDTVPLRHVVSDKVGVSRARNLGVACARHEVVAVTDDDCVVDTGWASRIEARFEAEPSLDALCGRILPYGAGRPGAEPVSVRPSTVACRLPRFGDPARYGSGNNLAFRKAAFDAVGGYDEAIGPGTDILAGEDSELLFRLLRSGHAVSYDPEVLVHHDAWRPETEMLGLISSYSFGSAAYLAREVVMRGDPAAGAILAERLLRPLAQWLFNLAVQRPERRMAAQQRLTGSAAGLWAVLTCDAGRGITRQWLRARRREEA